MTSPLNNQSMLLDFKYGNTRFSNKREIFDADKLSYVVNNYSDFKQIIEDGRKNRGDIRDVDTEALIKKYLARSRGGYIDVRYRQNSGIGRHCAVGSVSMQNMTREIRHTICRDYYVDVDICNAHLIFAEWICQQYNWECHYISDYIENREARLKELCDLNDITRGQAKQTYLSLLNGGRKAYDQLKQKTDKLELFKREVLDIHDKVAAKFPDMFEECKKKKLVQKKTTNLKASFLNILLCHIENHVLEAMLEFFGDPEICVKCFDGVMLLKDKEYDLRKCEAFILEKLKIKIKLDIKPFNNFLPIPDNIPKYRDIELKYFSQYIEFTKREFTLAEAKEWANNAIKIVDDVFYTRKKKHQKFGDHLEEYDIFSLKTRCKLFNKLKINCKILNPDHNPQLATWWSRLDKKEQKKFEPKPDPLALKKYLYTTLGESYRDVDEGTKTGFIGSMLKFGKLKEYTDVTYHPFLIKDSSPQNEFNLFTGFPLAKYRDKVKVDRFLESKVYKHLTEEMLGGDPGEINHYWDFIADMIQDPTKIKETFHLFYSEPGCGKGTCVIQFLVNLLGNANVFVIPDHKKYLEKRFNADSVFKILKIWEEVPSLGEVFKKNDIIKDQVSRKTESFEPKGIDPITVPHFSRHIFTSNHRTGTAYIEKGERRCTAHKVNNAYAKNIAHFKVLTRDIEDIEFCKSAFKFFAERKYSTDNVRLAYTNQYKEELKKDCLPSGLKFLIELTLDTFDDIKSNQKAIPVKNFNNKYKEYCCNIGSKYNVNAMRTQLRKINFNQFKGYKRFKLDCQPEYVAFCYIFSPLDVQNVIRSYLEQDCYILPFEKETGTIKEKDLMQSPDWY
jgi:hypothetical protein